MPRITFMPEDLEVEAPVGTGLQKIAEAAGADLTFGCGTGACGTCRVRIEGQPGCASLPNAEERDFLRDLKAPVDQRLACQVKVHGDLRVTYVGN